MKNKKLFNIINIDIKIYIKHSDYNDFFANLRNLNTYHLQINLI